MDEMKLQINSMTQALIADTKDAIFVDLQLMLLEKNKQQNKLKIAKNLNHIFIQKKI